MQQPIRSIAIALALLSCITIPALAQPHKQASKHVNSKQLQYTPPPLPSSGTPVGRRRGAAGRSGDCAALPLTALVPTTEQTLGERKVTYVWAKTIAEYPTFWFYVPDARPALDSVEFVLQDEQDKDVYRTRVSLPDRPGIISLRLPPTATPLKVNQNYHWFFKIAGENSCIPAGNLVKDSVEGWVQRVSPDPTLTNQLTAVTPQQRLTLYAAHGLWYEALTTLAELRRQQPTNADLALNWSQLLQSVGLSSVASQPLVPCCTATN